MKPRSKSSYRKAGNAALAARLAVGVLFMTCCLVVTTSCGRVDKAQVRTWVAALLRTDDAAVREETIARIISSGIGVDEVAALLHEGMTYENAEPGWTVHERVCTDGKTRPFHVYVPIGYDPAIAAGVLFDLHGGRMGEPLPPEEHFVGRTIWQESADRLNFILVYPQADAGATWFDDVGLENVLGQLAFVKRTYNINENRVFLSGYSAGAAGTMWHAFHNPTPWAGFLVFSGYYDIGSIGPYPCFVRNLFNRPLHATSGLYDGVIPIEIVQPFAEQYQQMGIDFAWQIYPVAHNVGFVDWERPKMEAFLTEHVRDPAGARAVWETASGATGRCDWLRIDEIADVADNAEFEEWNVYLEADDAGFGASLAYQGSGSYSVVGVQPGSVAHQVGVRTDDRILAINGIEVATPGDMDEAIAGKQPRDAIEIDVLREQETVTLIGEMPPREPAYPAPAISGAIEAQSSGNQLEILVRNVSQFSIFLGSDHFDLSRPIRVVVNGRVAFNGIVEPDLRFMLEQAAADLDRTAVYEACLSITLDPASND